MNLLSFPDINVWLALAVSEHVHSEAARRWWRTNSGRIAFSRLTQIGFLRTMTTAAAMGGKPISMDEAWGVYDRFYADDRVVFLAEPAGTEMRFREYTAQPLSSPKLWADAWLLAFAGEAGATLVTFDRALAARGGLCLIDGE